jgi:hypothetical protein
MHKRRIPWLEIVAVSALTVIAFTVVLVLFPSMKSEVKAAWLQAFGSIGAILGALYLGERQASAALNNEMKLKRNELRRWTDSILAIAEAANEQAKELEKIYSNGIAHDLDIFLVYDSAAMKHIDEALSSVPVHELGSYKAVTAFIELRKSFANLQKHVGRDFELRGKRDSISQGEFDNKAKEYAEFVRINFTLVKNYFTKLSAAFEEQISAVGGFSA